MDIGAQNIQECSGVLFRKDQRTGNRSKRRYDERAITFGLYWPAGAFELPHYRIGIDSNHQQVSQRGGFAQVVNVSGVKDIETPVGGNQFSAFGPQGRKLCRKRAGVGENRAD
jgi:hypothetical protein